MKVVVSATRHPHALSRRQVEAIFATLPAEITTMVSEVSLESSPIHAGRFVWDDQGRRARLALVVPEKTAGTTSHAVRTLLDGLYRVKAGLPLNERVHRPHPDAEAFIEKWLPPCLTAAT